NEPIVQTTNPALAQPSPSAAPFSQAPVTGTTPDMTNMPVTSLPGQQGVEAPTNGVAGTVTSAPPSTSTLPQSSNNRTASPQIIPLSKIKSQPATQTSTYFFSDPEVKPDS